MPISSTPTLCSATKSKLSPAIGQKNRSRPIPGTAPFLQQQKTKHPRLFPCKPPGRLWVFLVGERPSPEGRGFGSTAKPLVLPRALPLGELSPQVTERARTLSAAPQKSSPLGRAVEHMRDCEGLRNSDCPPPLDAAATGFVNAFPRPGEGGCDRREQTNEGAPADGANGYSPLIRHFVPPVPLLALRATSPGAGESLPQGGKASAETVNFAAPQKSSPLGRAVERMRD